MGRIINLSTALTKRFYARHMSGKRNMPWTVKGKRPAFNDEAVDRLLGRLRALPHPVTVRIGTRHPVTLPMRITDPLCAVLRRHAPLLAS